MSIIQVSPAPASRQFTQQASENAFIIGVAFLGIFSLFAGFVNNKIAIIVLRALMGIGK